ncbi:MAG: HEAT repeat domain-containing protein [Pseudomonadota bacterium]
MGKFVFLLVLLAIPGTLRAQEIDADALIATITGRAETVDKLLPYLESEDTSVRLAAFETIIGTDDPALLELAISMGFNDADEVVRARALKEVLFRRSNIAIRIDRAALEEDEAITAALDRLKFGAEEVWPFFERFPETSCINLYTRADCYGPAHLNISGLTVSFANSNNQTEGQFVLEDDGILRGHVNYSGVAIPAEMVVR